MNDRYKRQSGAALIVALVLLFITTLISLASARSSVLELRMATNSQAKAEAFQHAQSALDWLAESAMLNPNLLPDRPGFNTFCTNTANSTHDDGCDSQTLAPPAPVNHDSPAETNSLRVTRENCPPLPTGGTCGYCMRAESRYQGPANAVIAVGLRLGC